ncbi:MAG TPA: bifunctional YncE family protein/alkaline phosphatase family protein [Pyrinomonadaceae bacterium]|nr:bifunctional YncE family protein/alkaline phosphatase family protein [Pyrinomonadaceae bacterium]
MSRPFQSRGVSLALVAVLAALSFALVGSSADVRVKNRPASQGRPITPAGSLVMDRATKRAAVGSMPVAFVRGPERGGRGRYLVAVNSGYGLQFGEATNKAQQSLSVIDLSLRPPAVVQNVYFPTPQSANVGAAFSARADSEGFHRLYVSGGFENKVWSFRFRPDDATPVTPASPGPDTKVSADSIDLGGLAKSDFTERDNGGRAPVYPAGLALDEVGNRLFVAANLDDSLAVVSDPEGERRVTRVSLKREGGAQLIYPYAVAVKGGAGARGLPPGANAAPVKGGGAKAYVSCWGDASVAVVYADEPTRPLKFINVGRHPTAMTLNGDESRLYVVNSNADSVSVIDTEADREIEYVDVRLSERARIGSSPEGLALSDDGGTLYVANAHSNSVAVVALSGYARGLTTAEQERRSAVFQRSSVRGFIPTGQYPSAVAVADGTVYVGNGKGTGVENSSAVVDNSGSVPNAPNERFPAGAGRERQGGQYSVSIVSGNMSAIAEPDARTLARYTRQVMTNDGLFAAPRAKLFAGRSPIKHVIYVIKENRTYDQVFGDVRRAGDGTRADGDASLAIFGAGAAARVRAGEAQDITPNHRALALRFGLFDRFFVNAEASADGHNWSDAAFSTDYTDKAFRWQYSDRGRTYDFEGFNRLPDMWIDGKTPPVFPAPVTARDVADFVRRHAPDLNGTRDVAEPETRYLWDAAARAGLTFRNYGEFVSTLSEADVAALNSNRPKRYPDFSAIVSAFPTKRTLEGHHSTEYPRFDLNVPDAMTPDSYTAARASDGVALVSDANADERLRGRSRMGVWLGEFRRAAALRERGGPDTLPNLSIMQLPQDHTWGLDADKPTPQFCVADNDYALGLLVEAVSASVYWKDTAVFVVEDDAQDGPDHVDAHRSVALVISAYNRPGLLVHEYHNTVSIVRTLEMLLGIPPLNQLDDAASPADIFRAGADLTPYRAVLPRVAPGNLMTGAPRDAAEAYWMRRTAEQSLAHPDMADARALNGAIWFSVRGASDVMPDPARLPASDAMRAGTDAEAEEEEEDDE